MSLHIEVPRWGKAVFLAFQTGMGVRLRHPWLLAMVTQLLTSRKPNYYLEDYLVNMESKNQVQPAFPPRGALHVLDSHLAPQWTLSHPLSISWDVTSSEAFWSPCHSLMSPYSFLAPVTICHLICLLSLSPPVDSTEPSIKRHKPAALETSTHFIWLAQCFPQNYIGNL